MGREESGKGLRRSRERNRNRQMENSEREIAEKK